MQYRVLPLEEGKDPAPIINKTNPMKVLPIRLLQLLSLFLALCVTFLFCSMYMIRYFGVDTIISSSDQSLFRPCFEESNSIDRWIKPPSKLLHTMSDEELYWRATFVPRTKKYPFVRVPKIAFMFLTKGPLPMAPLWERYFKGHEDLYNIYIHSLPSFHAYFLKSSVFYKRQIPSKVTEWGEMSMCDAEKRLLANALLDISNEWFVLLSESCIPVHNFTTTYNYLRRSKHSFIGSFDDPSWAGRGRYDERMAPEVSIDQWRKGSQWFEVNRRLAITIVEDTVYYRKFNEFCKPQCYVDEHYFPTMLSIEVPHLLANRSITWVDWSRGGPHPGTFGKFDINEEFLKRIVEDKTCMYNNRPNSICFLFARKFARSSLEPLLKLSPKMLGY